MKRTYPVILAILIALWRPVPPAEAVGVSAASAVLYEPRTGTVLYEKDCHTPRPMASTTKLMTALIAAETGEWERTVTVTAEMAAVEGTALGLRAGDTLTLRDAVAGMLIVSGNDAANAVALTLADSLPAFAERMNRKAAELGMTDSRFVTPSGLDGEGHAASAYDMALLAAAVLQDPTLAAICAAQRETLHISGRSVTVTNHNRLLSTYEGAVGMKTGFTKKAGRCLVSAATREGVTLIAVTLNDGDDWRDHAALLDYGFSKVKRLELPPVSLPLMSVTGGERGEAVLSVPPAPDQILLSDQPGEVTVTLRLPPFLFAPVKKGDRVGEAIYSVDGVALPPLPVTAAADVAARPVTSGMDRFRRNLRLLWAGLFGIST